MLSSLETVNMLSMNVCLQEQLPFSKQNTHPGASHRRMSQLIKANGQATGT